MRLWLRSICASFGGLSKTSVFEKCSISFNSTLPTLPTEIYTTCPRSVKTPEEFRKPDKERTNTNVLAEPHTDSIDGTGSNFGGARASYEYATQGSLRRYCFPHSGNGQGRTNTQIQDHKSCAALYTQQSAKVIKKTFKGYETFQLQTT